MRLTLTASLPADGAEPEASSFQLTSWTISMDERKLSRIIGAAISNPFVVRAIAQRQRRKMAASAAKARTEQEDATRTETPWIPTTIGIQGWLPG